MIGQVIDHYRITEKIGQGGMGEVYKAVDVNLDRVVAIKVLNRELSQDANLIQRFQAEAKTQAQMNHPNICTLYNFFNHGGQLFMVMEFIEGMNLEQLVHQRGPIPFPEAIPLFQQALFGLSQAHRMGVIHRDIKPSNIIINRQGIVKVMDFGIARVVGHSRLTRTGLQVGTLYYMCPEQIQGRDVDFRGDIYALGITLFELLTGSVPFSANTDFEIMQAHVKTPPPAPSKVYPEPAEGAGPGHPESAGEGPAQPLPDRGGILPGAGRGAPGGAPGGARRTEEDGRFRPRGHGCLPAGRDRRLPAGAAPGGPGATVAATAMIPSVGADKKKILIIGAVAAAAIIFVLIAAVVLAVVLGKKSHKTTPAVAGGGGVVQSGPPSGGPPVSQPTTFSGGNTEKGPSTPAACPGWRRPRGSRRSRSRKRPSPGPSKGGPSPAPPRTLRRNPSRSRRSRRNRPPPAAPTPPCSRPSTRPTRRIPSSATSNRPTTTSCTTPSRSCGWTRTTATPRSSRATPPGWSTGRSSR